MPGARLIPTPARGLSEECGLRIPPLGPARSRLLHPGWVRSSAAPHHGARVKVSRGSRAKRGWTSEGAILSGLLRLPPTPIPDPETVSGPPPYLREGHKSPAPAWAPLTGATPERTTCGFHPPCAPQLHLVGYRGILPFPGAWPCSRSAPPASKVAAVPPKPVRHGSEAAHGIQQTSA